MSPPVCVSSSSIGQLARPCVWCHLVELVAVSMSGNIPGLNLDRGGIFFAVYWRVNYLPFSSYQSPIQQFYFYISDSVALGPTSEKPSGQQ